VSWFSLSSRLDWQSLRGALWSRHSAFLPPGSLDSFSACHHGAAQETPTERAGVLALPEKKLGRYRTVSLTKLQWLGGHGLLVVAETAAKSDRRCDDDRAS
jgi:hypothetical protein